MVFTHQNINYEYSDYSILIVDDVPSNIKTLSIMLSSLGLKLFIATGGSQAIETAKAKIPDLILLDINMPDVNGFMVCDELKSYDKTAGIPIIFITAINETETIVKGFECGGIDYITKPFQSKEMIARISTHLAMLTIQRNLAKANKQIRRDLELAAKYQQSFIPIGNKKIGNINCETRFMPSSYLSGDIFNFFPTLSNKSAFYIADVSGNGIPAAFLSVSIARRLNNENKPENPVYKCNESNSLTCLNSPQELLIKLNKLYLSNNRTSEYFTMIYGVVDEISGDMIIATAGHPPPIIIKGNEAKVPELTGFPVGMFDSASFESFEIPSNSYERIVFFSDGLADAFEMKNQSLNEFINENIELNSKLLADAICQKVAHLVDDMQDDISLMILEQII